MTIDERSELASKIDYMCEILREIEERLARGQKIAAKLRMDALVREFERLYAKEL